MEQFQYLRENIKPVKTYLTSRRKKLLSKRFSECTVILCVSIICLGLSVYSGSAVDIILITPEKAIKLVANDFFFATFLLFLARSINESSLNFEDTFSLYIFFRNLSFFRGMIAGGLAAMFQIIVTTPMELLKMQVQD
ncbi:hypothetical protein KIN20_019637 [Parelaphostrongylus tenuis]|uniref:Uncharacterized protein n=1 Tax=Parelaphostrongylus tenuis TaxID=148309 RepID=A0AAD5QV62_PARTN|nr:hypothetical protein KIN20_019637 [Parelaphostrongylus tenuis]